MTIQAPNIQWPQGTAYLDGDRGTDALGRKLITPAVVEVVGSAENFEGGIAGTGTWTITTSSPHTGTNCIRSAVIGNNGTTDQVFAVPGGAVQLRFWHRVSSELNFDFFRVLVDATQVFTLSGTTNVWAQQTINVTGATTVTFRYTKDGSSSAGLDAAFVDDLEWITTAFVPAVQVHEPLQLDSSNRLKVIADQGTSPWVVTGALAVAGTARDDTDNQAAVATGALLSVGRTYIWDSGGGNWDRWTGLVQAAQSGTWTVDAVQSGVWTTGRTWTLGFATDSVTVVQGTSPWVVSGTVTADTELPAASALADADANPTTSRIGSNLLGYNGTTWDRLRSGGDNADNESAVSLGALLVKGRTYIWDSAGSNWDRWTGAVTVTDNTTGTLANGAETTVAGSAVSVLASNSNRKACILQNTGIANVRVGVSGVTATTGFRLSPGQIVILEKPFVPTQQIFAIREGAVSSTVLAQEIT